MVTIPRALFPPRTRIGLSDELPPAYRSDMARVRRAAEKPVNWRGSKPPPPRPAGSLTPKPRRSAFKRRSQI